MLCNPAGSNSIICNNPHFINLPQIASDFFFFNASCLSYSCYAILTYNSIEILTHIYRLHPSIEKKTLNARNAWLILTVISYEKAMKRLHFVVRNDTKL